jgi:hypothetical protein
VRAERLSADARRVLEVASVAGQRFELALVAELAGETAIYVLEHAGGANGPFAGTPGRLLRVGRDCSRTPVRTGLAAPGSVAIGPDGHAYVSINSTSATTGAVLRIDPSNP